MSELELIDAIVNGSKDHLDEFYRIYSPLVVRVFRCKGVPCEELGDLVQEFFVHLTEGDCRRLRSWRGCATLSTWITAVANRFAVDFFRRWRPLERLDEDAYARQPDDRIPEPDSLRWLEQRRRMLDRILETQLAGKPGELIRRRYYEEQSIAEIARDLQMTENNVRVAISRAMTKLRALPPAVIYRQEELCNG